MAKLGHTKHKAHMRNTTRYLSPVLLRRAGECISNKNCVTGTSCSQYGYRGTGPAYCGSVSGQDVQGNDDYVANFTNHSDVNGSIYRFGSANDCRQVFREVGACGISTYFPNVPSDSSFVAMPAGVFDQYGSAQHNTLCGKTITLTHNGVSRTAVVADRNLSDDNSIDMCLDLWTAFGGHDRDGTLFRSVSFNMAL